MLDFRCDDHEAVPVHGTQPVHALVGGLEWIAADGLDIPCLLTSLINKLGMRKCTQCHSSHHTQRVCRPTAIPPHLLWAACPDRRTSISAGMRVGHGHVTRSPLGTSPSRCGNVYTYSPPFPPSAKNCLVGFQLMDSMHAE
jgi:hypothetical protein